MGLLTIGTVLRADKHFDRNAPTVEGLPNYYHVTRPANDTASLPILARGITRMTVPDRESFESDRGVGRKPFRSDLPHLSYPS